MQRNTTAKQSTVPSPKASSLNRGMSDATFKWILILPATIAVIALLIFPFLFTFVASFTDWHLFNLNAPINFVGFKMWASVLTSSYIHTTTWNTIYFVGLALPLQFLLGLMVALALNAATFGRTFFRVFFLMPLMFNPIAVVFLIGKLMLQEDIGPINDVLMGLGFPRIMWLSNPAMAKITIVLVDVWQHTAFMILMFLAGLQSLPQEPFEAAVVDGATAVQRFRLHLTAALGPRSSHGCPDTRVGRVQSRGHYLFVDRGRSWAGDRVDNLDRFSDGCEGRRYCLWLSRFLSIADYDGCLYGNGPVPHAQMGEDFILGRTARMTQERRLGRIVAYIILVTWTFVVGIPTYWLFITAFKRPEAINRGATYIPWVDFQPSLLAFYDVFVLQGLASSRPFVNSVVVALATATISTVIGGAGGYALARFPFRVGPLNNDRIAFGFLIQRMFPPAVLLIPFLILFRTLRLLDTREGLVLVYCAFSIPFVVWIMRDFFRSLPVEIEESALIDGCNRLGVLFRIAIPLSAPGFVTRFCPGDDRLLE